MVVATIKESFKAYADRVFVIDPTKGQEFTYAQIEQYAKQLAQLLSEKGVKHGDTVGLILPNSIVYVCMYFALFFLGATAVPINIHLKAKEIQDILSDVSADFVIGNSQGDLVVDASFFDKIKSTAVTQEFLALTDDDLMAIIYTSGTTGKPKGVELSAYALIKSSMAYATAIGLDSTSRCYNVFDMAYLGGFADGMLTFFVVGGSFVGDLRFFTNPTGALNAETEKMRILGNGNVGIGTDSPTQLLDVAGNFNMSSLGANITLGKGRIYWDDANGRLVIRVT